MAGLKESTTKGPNTFFVTPPSLEEQALLLPPPPPTIFHPKYLKKNKKKLKKTATRTKKTSLYITYDVGYGNTLYIRGRGADLTWEKGVPLINISHDQWCWETELSFETLEFKILINDSAFETCFNHTLTCGEQLTLTPSF